MPARSVALVVLVTAIWGVNFVVIHEGLEHFPPLLFNSLRFALMAVPAIFLVGRPRVPWRYVLGIGAALGVVKFGLLFVSIDQGLPVGLSSLLLQLQVVFTIAFAAIALGERPRREQVAGAAVAFAGLGVIAIDRAASAPVLPFVLVVGAAAAWGVSNTLTRKAQPPDALALLVWASLVAPLPLLGLSLAFEGPAEIGDALAGVDAAAIGSLLFVAGVSGLFGFAAWIGLLKRHSAASVTPFALLVPVFGIASAALLLGERPSGLELGGAVLICAGLAATLLPPRAQRGSSARRCAARHQAISSMCSTFARSSASAEGAPANHASRISSSTAADVARSDSARTLASFQRRAPSAVAASPQSAARTPATLFAAIDAPVPVQQQTMPCSARPSATSRAAASDAQAQSSRSDSLSAPCSSGSCPRRRTSSTTASATPVRSSAAIAIRMVGRA